MMGFRHQINGGNACLYQPRSLSQSHSSHIHEEAELNNDDSAHLDCTRPISRKYKRKHRQNVSSIYYLKF